MRIDFRQGQPKRIVLLKSERDALNKVADVIGGLAMFWPERFETLQCELAELRESIEEDGELKGVDDGYLDDSGKAEIETTRGND